MRETPLVYTDIVFNAKPDAVPYNYRISYKVTQLCLIMRICGRGDVCSLIKLHMISFALISQENMRKLVDFADGIGSAPIVRFDPSVNRALTYEKYRAVQEQNSDFVGWLSVPGTNIDYPVMQTVDEPNFYLKRGFDKQYSDYGVPYVQENCDIALSDNCVIYGHHMNNGTMFTDLCKYENEDFYREHKTIHFDTLSGFGEYEIVAVFKTVAYSEQGFKYYHFTRAESAEDFDDYIAQCKALSLYDTGVTAEYGDRLITLSTCEYSRKNGRMVVVAKRIAAPSAEVGSDA